MPNIPSKQFANLHPAPIRILKSQVSAPFSMPNFHYHDSYEIYYLTSGERFYFINDKTYHVKKGMLVLIKAYDLHCTANNKDSSHSRILVNFKKTFLRELSEAFEEENLFSCFEKGVHLVTLSLDEQDFVEALLERMLLEQEKKESGSQFFLKTALSQLLMLVNRKTDRLIDATNTYISPTHKVINEAVAFININYASDISLPCISEKFFISPYYFSRIFKTVTGLSFIDFLNKIRIKEAQKLMRTTTMNITEIGDAVGYKSTTHFGRIFKKHTGMSPTAYRKGTK